MPIQGKRKQNRRIMVKFKMRAEEENLTPQQDTRDFLKEGKWFLEGGA